MRMSERAGLRFVCFPLLWVVLASAVLAWTGKAGAETQTTASASRVFGDVVNTVRGQGAETDVFGEAVSGLGAGTVVPPLAFRLGEETQDAFWGRAQRTLATRSEVGGTVHEIGYKDSVTGLSCRMELREIRDFPAVEWVVHFSNEGTNALPVLTDVDALQLSWKCPGDAFVYRAPGGKETPLDFQFQREPLQTIRRQGLSLAMNAGSEGRSSVDWLPFFNLQSGNDGLIVVIGWTGQWFATVGRSGDVAHLRAGMEGVRVSLRPGGNDPNAARAVAALAR